MRILITSKNGYISNKLAEYLKKIHPYFNITQKSIRNNSIPPLNGYDVVVHTAGLVHKKEKKISSSIYTKINTDLTTELALKAKESYVKQFIFISSMAVYGIEPNLNKPVIITKSTKPNPTTSYGKSKLEAEKSLLYTASSNFHIAIIRPPMVYGHNAPGNYNTLVNFSKNSPIFPLVKNEKSVLHILNLCQLINLIISSKSLGIFYPQDKEYINTSEFIQSITPNGKQIKLSSTLGGVVTAFDTDLTRKVFGNLVYDKQMSNHFKGKYIVYPNTNNVNIKNRSTEGNDYNV